jgi:Signal peptidase, peptidase S26
VQTQLGSSVQSHTVPKGHLWIEGDNAAHSIDSRTFGPLPIGLVQGRIAIAVRELLNSAYACSLCPCSYHLLLCLCVCVSVCLCLCFIVLICTYTRFIHSIVSVSFLRKSQRPHQVGTLPVFLKMQIQIECAAKRTMTLILIFCFFVFFFCILSRGLRIYDFWHSSNT